MARTRRRLLRLEEQRAEARRAFEQAVVAAVDAGATLREVGGWCGLSAERVNQIYRRGRKGGK
ncbi:MAG: hypothetical protein QN122_12495 [Armatimonadota bacterium]|nr:hypothetical protein [Armatimonadota bacterium]